MISKVEARIFGKAMRQSITGEERTKKEKNIEDYFLSLSELDFCTNVCVYNAIGSEVSINGIIKSLRKLGKNLFAPITVGEDMYAVSFDEKSTLIKGQFGIPEPKGEKISSDKLDLIVVPIVAFNSKRDRIGYGKGYYDRFILEKALTVGIAFSEQECDFIPDMFDKTLDIIITDKGVMR